MRRVSFRLIVDLTPIAVRDAVARLWFTFGIGRSVTRMRLALTRAPGANRTISMAPTEPMCGTPTPTIRNVFSRIDSCAMHGPPTCRTDATERWHALALFDARRQGKFNNVMTRSRSLFAGLGIVALFSTSSHAQELFNDLSQMSREQWRTRVQSSRERAETIRRERRTFTPQPPTPEEVAEEASRRVLEDDSLRPGDVVSTNRGFFRFQGPPDREPRPDDFVRIR